MIHTSPAGFGLIKKFEGLRLTAYKCPAGVWTIGYGHTRNVKEHDTITESAANYLLEQDVEKFESAVDRMVNVPLTQNMYDALIGFTFNLGAGALSSSTLLSLLNKGDYKLAAREFYKWNHAGGKELAGLTARRDAEAKLFVTGMGVMPYVSTKASGP